LYHHIVGRLLSLFINNIENISHGIFFFLTKGVTHCACTLRDTRLDVYTPFLKKTLNRIYELTKIKIQNRTENNGGHGKRLT